MKLESVVKWTTFGVAWLAAWYFGIYLTSVNVWPQLIVGSALWLTFPWWVRFVARPFVGLRPGAGARK